MSLLRRLIAPLLLTLPLALTTVSAQTEMSAGSGEPLTVDDAIQRALAKNFSIR